MLLYEALGWDLPQYAHLPLLRNKDKSKISKRKNPTSLLWYRSQGYLPSALINFLALMGWSHPEGKEQFDIDDMVKHFSFDRIGTVGPVFDLTKLEWLNGVYIRQLSVEKLYDLLKKEGFLDQIDAEKEYVMKVLPLIHERLKKLLEFHELTDFFFSAVRYDIKELFVKGRGREDAQTALNAFLKETKSLAEKDWKAKTLEPKGRTLVDTLEWKAGELFMLLRVAVTGKTATPPLFETMEVLGKETTLARIEYALTALQK